MAISMPSSRPISWSLPLPTLPNKLQFDALTPPSNRRKNRADRKIAFCQPLLFFVGFGISRQSAGLFAFFDEAATIGVKEFTKLFNLAEKFAPPVRVAHTHTMGAEFHQSVGGDDIRAVLHGLFRRCERLVLHELNPRLW